MNATSRLPVTTRRELTPPLALVAVMVSGQAVAVFAVGARTVIFVVSMLVLDVLGTVFSLRAARRSRFPAAWRISAAGRVCGVLAPLTMAASLATGVQAWWYASIVARLAMFVLLSGGAVYVPIRVLKGRRRSAFLAEAGIVFGGGFMLIWYFILSPQLAGQRPSAHWVPIICFPAGDLLVLTAIAALVLSGAVRGIVTPVSCFVGGLTLFVVADAFLANARVHNLDSTNFLIAYLVMICAAVLMTIAPMLVSIDMSPGIKRYDDVRRPMWSMTLPLLAIVIGISLLLTAAVDQRQFFPWGGLTLGLIIMMTAVVTRQIISGRDSRDQILADALTGLVNRTGLNAALTRALRNGTDIALLLIDLDDFKLINDGYGHHAGDTVLTAFAHHLQSSIRATDLACRLGGDEFVVLLSGISNPQQAEEVADRILTIVSANPIQLGDDFLPVHASIGITTSQTGDTDRELLRRADMAMYQAKRAGSHTYIVYESSMVDRRAEEAALSEDLNGALERGELHLVYQPLVSLEDGRPIAAEALLRWQHPTRGLVPPMTFIPVAERSGAISAIGLWVIEQACRQLARWQTMRPRHQPLYVSINVSPRQLHEPTLVLDVLAVIQRTGVAAQHLVLEVTESGLADSSTSLRTLHALRSHGIRIAIDDFGTGYSSLHYLTKLPVDVLKIDRSFVTQLDGSTDGSAITEAIIRLGHVLRLTTVAEGIETVEQATELQMLGCDIGQGYLFSRPLPADELHNIDISQE